jgi:hypothetical protein
MNKILLSILLSLVSFFGFSQTVSEPYKLWPRANFRPPQDTVIAPERLGEMRYKQSDGKYYKAVSLTGNRWVEFGSGGAGSPGGSATQVQYNNAGAFAGSPDLVWDNAGSRLQPKRLTVTSSGSGSENEYPFRVTNSTTGAEFRIGVAGGSEIGGVESVIYAAGVRQVEFKTYGTFFSTNRVGNPQIGMQWAGLGGGTVLGVGHHFVTNTFNEGNFTATTGEQINVTTGDNFSGNENWAPSSGNATYTLYRARPLINTTGTYAGTVRGFLFDPQLTSTIGLALNAFQSTYGNWIMGSGGRLWGSNSTNTTSGPLIHFGDDNKVVIDGQGYGARTESNLSINGLMFNTNNLLTDGYIKTKGGTTAVNTPFPIIAITRPDESAQTNGQGIAEITGIFDQGIWTSGIAMGFNTAAGGDISGGSGKAERMRIHSDGNVSIGSTANSGFKFDVNGTTRTQGHLHLGATPESDDALTNILVRDPSTGRVKTRTAASLGGGSATWGGITGTLSSQTDLQTALNGKESSITSGTTSQYWRGDKTFQNLDKAAVGLGSVDNTSDLNKPISTATQSALDTKQATLVSGTNIRTINGASVLGSGDLVVSGGVTINNNSNNNLVTASGTANTLDGEGALTFNGTTLNVNTTGSLDLPDGTTAERPATGNGGLRFNTDSKTLDVYDGLRWTSAGGQAVRSFAKRGYYYHQEFLQTVGTGGDGNLLATNSGSSAASSATATDATNRPGLVRATTGTTATGRTAVATGATSFRLGGGAWVYEAFLNPTTLSSGTERYQLAVGFIDTYNAANQVDGVYFLYDEGGVSTGSTAAAYWQTVTTSNSARAFNTSLTQSTVNAATWVKLRIELNASATEASFYINDNLVATHTTNIPTAAGRELGFGYLLIKSVGTTARTVDFDYLNVENEFTTQR